MSRMSPMLHIQFQCSHTDYKERHTNLQMTTTVPIVLQGIRVKQNIVST